MTTGFDTGVGAGSIKTGLYSDTGGVGEVGPWLETDTSAHPAPKRISESSDDAKTKCFFIFIFNTVTA